MREQGQASVESAGLMLLVALLLVGILAAARTIDTSLGHEIAERIICAVARDCEPSHPVEKAYGEEVAALVREHAPVISYEEGMRALPVDFRDCLAEVACSDGRQGAGPIARTRVGLPVTAFVHVVDRREAGGALYIQYWLYYGDSVAGRHFGRHEHDWESYQVRVRPDGAEARASAHHAYAYDTGLRSVVEQTGHVPARDGWGPATGWLQVSGGSHAGHIRGGRPGTRITRREAIRLVPLEPLADGVPDDFGQITPPWRKSVWQDPESTRT